MSSVISRNAVGGASPRGREIGPVGTTARVLGGLIAIAVPIAISGIEWWDVAAALVVLPLVATAIGVLLLAGYERYAPGSLVRSHAVFSVPGCLLLGAVIGVGIGLTFITPVDGGVAIWSFLGVSMLVAALRGYGGCEVLAIPNTITGECPRSDRIGCIIYTPIDLAEARHSRVTARPTA